MTRPAAEPVLNAHDDAAREAELAPTDTRPAREIHVEPTAGGRWAVCYEHGKRALSDHLTANEAQYFAKQRARAEGITGIVVHDAYLHVHEVFNF